VAGAVSVIDAVGGSGPTLLLCRRAFVDLFVDLWKNADPELQPKVTEVKQRLARLGDIEKR
jgi:hypothetical protein